MPAKSQARREYQNEWCAKKRRSLGVPTLSESKMGEKNPNWKGGSTPESKAAYAREWRKKNADYVRNREYKKRFGITLHEFNRLNEKQEGVCAICHCIPGRRRLEVDHCHKTGDVRGLLCETCNRAIGLFDDNPALLASASKYLENAIQKRISKKVLVRD